MEVKHLNVKKILLTVLSAVMIIIITKVLTTNYCIINLHIYDRSITSIDLTDQKLNKSDLKKLSSLNNLEELYIFNAEISDISFLCEMDNLQKLFIGGRISTNITDWSPLQSCKSLKYLRVWDTDFEDLHYIKDLRNLEILDMCEGNNVSNIEDIVSLSNLKEIYLESGKLTDISSIEQLEQIERIYIYSSSVEKLPDFSKCKSIKELTLTDCNTLKNADGLKNSSIETLDLSGSRIDDHSFLFEMPQLTKLTISQGDLTEEQLRNLEQNGVAVLVK